MLHLLPTAGEETATTAQYLSTFIRRLRQIDADYL